MSNAREWETYFPALLIIVWWIYDLHFVWGSAPEYNFGWIVVLLVSYLVWERWPTRPDKDVSLPLWKTGLIVTAGLPLVLVAELYKNAIGRTPSSSMALSLGCTLFILGILLNGRGPRTLRHFLFALLFIFVAVPVPKIVWNPIVLGLQNLITALNVETLNLIGIPAVQHRNIIALPNCMVGVDEACSGVRSLQSSIMAGLFLGYILLSRGSLRFALLLSGILLALLGNFLRSLYLSITAHQEGLQALQRLHDTAGWTVLLFTLVGLVLLSFIAVRVEQIIATALTGRLPRTENA